MASSNPFGDPGTMALFGLAQGLLSGGAPHPFPQGLGGALSQGIGGALNSANMATTMNQRQAMVDLEQQKLKQAQSQFGLQQDLLRRFGILPGGNAGAGGTAPNPNSPIVNPGANVPPISAVPEGIPNGAPGAQAFPFNTAQIAVMHLAGLPDLTGAYNAAQPNADIKNGVMYDRKSGAILGAVPQTNQQGFSTITVPDKSQPNGFRVEVVPGALPAFLAQQRAGEQAKAERDLVTVPPSSPNAQPTLRSRESVIQGGGGVPAGLSANQQAQVAANTEQQKDVAKNYAGIYNGLQNASMTNPTKIAKLERIGELLKDFEGSRLSKTGMDIAGVAQSAGIPIDPKLPNKQAAEALTGEVALQLRSTASGEGMPGSMSDSDREFLKGMTPSMASTSDGRKLIIESKVKVMQREMKVSDMAREYTKKYGQLDADFFSQLGAWSNRNPIFGQK